MLHCIKMISSKFCSYGFRHRILLAFDRITPDAGFVQNNQKRGGFVHSASSLSVCVLLAWRFITVKVTGVCQLPGFTPLVQVLALPTWNNWIKIALVVSVCIFAGKIQTIIKYWLIFIKNKADATENYLNIWYLNFSSFDIVKADEITCSLQGGQGKCRCSLV